MSALAYTCPLYHVNFILVVCREKHLAVELSTIVPKSFPPDYSTHIIEQARTASGLTMHFQWDKEAKKETLLLWVEYASWRKFAEWAAHESLHATQLVLNRVGLELNEHTVEAFTYYQGKVLRRLLELR